MARSFAPPMITDKKPVRDFFQLAIQHGLRDVVLSPGSRNAPFSVSLPSLNTLNTHVVVDERSAAFIALGMAQQTQRPVILICTSGTAPLNYAPALAEAYYQRVPLLVVTADRPHEWIDQGEGQSIRQTEVFRNFVKGSFEVRGEAQEGDGAWYNARLMDEAMRLCTDRVPGPVHLNFPLQEPLYRSGDSALQAVKSMERIAVHSALSAETRNNLQQEIDREGKVMVLAGQLPQEEALQHALARFSKRSNVLVLTEAHSHLTDERYITTIDRFLAAVDESEHDALRPNLLITIGHNIISRKIKQLLRSGNHTHWHIDITGEGLDTLKHLSRIIPQSPAEFFDAMGEGESTNSDYQSRWWERHVKSRHRSFEYMSQAAWS
ncbi:MAG: 2-succinyl-5-enolpyruvyl-6-hydroxy-3-cyclohexene-1-carboxylic-acid synthase, partial [Flavobacteriales bacterium]